MDVLPALERLGGISDRRPLLALTTRKEIEAALAAESIVRLSRGQYALPTADHARAAAATARGVVSHLSAAAVHRWKVKAPPARPSVTVRRSRSRVPAVDADLHWGSVSDEEQKAGVTDPVHTVIDCARTLAFDEALCVADSALRSWKVTPAALLAAAQAGPRTHRSRVLRVVATADARSANPFESVLRAIALGVPGFAAEPQGAVPGVGHADVADVLLRIALEAESWEYHGLREAFDYDIRRYTDMTRRGWLVVRFIWDDVMRKPAYVAEVIADLVALRAAGQEVGAISS